jgi:hypothetical protein
MCPTFEGNGKAETAAQASRQKNDHNPRVSSSHPSERNEGSQWECSWQGFDLSFLTNEAKNSNKNNDRQP